MRHMRKHWHEFSSDDRSNEDFGGDDDDDDDEDEDAADVGGSRKTRNFVFLALRADKTSALMRKHLRLTFKPSPFICPLDLLSRHRFVFFFALRSTLARLSCRMSELGRNPATSGLANICMNIHHTDINSERCETD
jgi:hypothetical protein